MQITANRIQIEVEDHGPPTGEPLLLIMGLGMQLVAWPEGFVQQLAAQGFRVIRFDNRDIGLSQSFDHLGPPALAVPAIRYALRLPVTSPYALADMADDTAGLLDVLGVPSAHVCGASMGGMVAQQLAMRHPARVKSLTLMMTSSGSRRLPGPALRVRAMLLGPAPDPTNVERVVARQVQLFQLIGSPGYPTSAEDLQRQFSMSVRRSYRPQGTVRQLMAIAADGDRSPGLARIRVPTQVLHGQADLMVPVPAGFDLAAKIPGARLEVIDGMGHDLPAVLWPRFVATIGTAAGRS